MVIEIVLDEGVTTTYNIILPENATLKTYGVTGETDENTTLCFKMKSGTGTGLTNGTEWTVQVGFDKAPVDAYGYTVTWGDKSVTLSDNAWHDIGTVTINGSDVDLSNAFTVTTVEKLAVEFVSWNEGSVVLKFNRPVDKNIAETVNTYAFIGVTAANVTATLGDDGMTVTLSVKDESFGIGHKVGVKKTYIEDADFPGNKLTGDVSWTFGPGYTATLNGG